MGRHIIIIVIITIAIKPAIVIIKTRVEEIGTIKLKPIREHTVTMEFKIKIRIITGIKIKNNKKIKPMLT